jgi:sugar phosphate isomerase/epimerase
VTFNSRLSLSAMSSLKFSLEADLELWQEIGCRRVGVSLAKVEAAGWKRGIETLRAAEDLMVETVMPGVSFHLDQPSQWGREREGLVRAVDAANTLGAACLCITTGAPGRLPTEEARAAFASAAWPVIQYAQGLDVAIAVEHVSMLSRDIGCVHSLVDAIDLAEESGSSVCLEMNNCWFERGLKETLQRGVKKIKVVQVSDFIVGTKCVPARAVPGDGDIPIATILSLLLESGYSGVFELEILGPRIEHEGYLSAIVRGLAHLEQLLDQLIA